MRPKKTDTPLDRVLLLSALDTTLLDGMTGEPMRHLQITKSLMAEAMGRMGRSVGRFGLTVLAVVFLVVPATRVDATHITQLTVDQIEGSGPGTFAGSFPGSAGGDTADWFTFFAPGGSNVTIQTTSATFDTYLTLYFSPSLPSVGDLRSSYTLIAQDDDSGGFPLSRIVSPVLSAGYYVFAVEQFGDGGGSYTVDVRGNVQAIDAVPEPAAFTLLGASLASIMALRRRRSRA